MVTVHLYVDIREPVKTGQWGYAWTISAFFMWSKTKSLQIFGNRMQLYGKNHKKIKNKHIATCLLIEDKNIVFPKMVVPAKHPKMIIFSRKTHGCWVPPF